jgi:hypothetical protein
MSLLESANSAQKLLSKHETLNLQGRYLAKRLAASDGFSDDQKPEADASRQGVEPADVEQLKGLVTEAYHELEDLYAWLRKKGVSKYGIAGAARPGVVSPRPRRHPAKKDHLGPARIP